jgi:chitodextrinase
VDPPTTLQSSSVGSDFLTVSWSGASAQEGIAHYNVYRNGVFVGTTTGPIDSDNTVNPGTTYVYTIQTVDSQGNISALSSSISVTTLPDLEVFTPPP